MAVAISPAIVGAEEVEVEFPLSHARIGYRTFIPASTITASSSAAGFPASAVALSMTYEKWKPTALPATITFDAGEGVEADYIGIAAHTLGSSEATAELEHSPDNSTWTSVDNRAFSDDSTFMLLFTKVQARYWRLTITGTTIPEIGVVYIGKVLEMQRMIYGGHSPGTLSRETEILPSRSEGGEFLGRSILRKGFATSFQWQNLKAAWYRANFDPFVEAARTEPFFIAWRPEDFPLEVLYCWTNSDISPTNQGTKDFMQVGLSVQGLG